MNMDPAASTFIDRMGVATEADGLSPIAGRLFATLLLSDEPRSLDELAESLAVSKASVSTDARRLLERGIVERVSRPGDRRDYYELAPDFFARIIRSRVARWHRLRDLTRAMRDASPELAPVVSQRMASIDAIHSFVLERVDEALAEWERLARGPAPTRAAKAPAPKRSAV